MARQKSNHTKIGELRDLAVQAVMRFGELEQSGNARLAVVRQAGLMIGYRTPFNPLPQPNDGAKYEAALEGKRFWHARYGIDVWLEDAGKVFSAAWNSGGEIDTRLYKPGSWQNTLLSLASRRETPVEPYAHSKILPRKRKSHNSKMAPATLVRRLDAMEATRLSELRAENHRLREVVSGPDLDSHSCSQAVCSKLS
jgi:hypothetical protein